MYIPSLEDEALRDLVRTHEDALKDLQLRLEKVPKAIQDSSWKAQVRLCKRYRRLMARGKNINQVVAIAREMAACVWAIAREVAVAH